MSPITIILSISLGTVVILAFALGMVFIITKVSEIELPSTRKKAAYRDGKRGYHFNPDNYKTTGFCSVDLATYRAMYLNGVYSRGYSVGVEGYASHARFMDFFYVTPDQEAIDTYREGHSEGYKDFTILHDILTTSK